MSPLSAETREKYVVIIDSILAASDLQTITSKRIRQGLQQAVGHDISKDKDDIKALINERFDQFAPADTSKAAPPEPVAAPATNGHTDAARPGVKPSKAVQDQKPTPGHKRKSDNEDQGAEDDDDEQLSDIVASPPPKKKRKAELDDDALFAARLQAEENNRARPTRGGATRKTTTTKKRTPKKKTASKVKAEDDSDLDASGSGAEKKVNRSGGFHKPLTLSAPLSALLDGEIQLSRPQTVKRIWAYVKERDLQDPKDKRLIRCDDALKAVFKSEKVHMFTMNKILGQNLYDPEV